MNNSISKETFQTVSKKICAKDSSLSSLVDTKLKILKAHPTNSNLRLHKLTGQKSQHWSIAIKSDLRLLFQFIPEGIILVDIGSHDEVY